MDELTWKIRQAVTGFSVGLVARKSRAAWKRFSVSADSLGGIIVGGLFIEEMHFH